MQYFAPIKTKLNMKNTKASQALHNFENGMNCAQSVVSVFAENLGLDLGTALRLTSALGGGVGRKQEICGAFSGAAIVIGLMHGNQTPSDKESKEMANTLTRQFLDKMEHEYGGLTCWHVLGTSLETNADRDKVKELNLTATKCNPCILSVVELLEQMEKNKK